MNEVRCPWCGNPIGSRTYIKPGDRKPQYIDFCDSCIEEKCEDIPDRTYDDFLERGSLSKK